MCDQKEIYDAVADQIKREDENVAKRINWFLTSQAFILTGLGLIADRNPLLLQGIIKQVGVLGMIISFGVLLGVLGAEFSTKSIKDFWDRNSLIMTCYPQPFGGKWAFIFGIIPRILIPVVFTVIWYIVGFESANLIEELKQNRAGLATPEAAPPAS
ncbi:MAG: hypothetical protein AAGC73_04405 [Verrucomicrobiota bacterium]